MLNKSTINLKDFQVHDQDTGSTGMQIALLTERIQKLSSHFEVHKKDLHSKQGLYKIINKRNSLLSYLLRTDAEKYKQLADALQIRTKGISSVFKKYSI